MKLLCCVVLGLLFFVSTVSSQVQVIPIFSPNVTATVYQTKSHLTVKCQITGDVDEVKWERDGTDVKKIDAIKGRVTLAKKDDVYSLSLEKATDIDGGNYSCVAYNKEAEVGRTYNFAACAVKVRTQHSVKVPEGESARIVCDIVSNPSPVITWIDGNGTHTESEGRIKLEDDDKGNVNAIYVLKNVQMEDTGTVTCQAYVPLSNTSDSSETIVRVKDKYAALWPFLGICAEVFVLCAIILIYEKKRNKTELEESDTDQSPDQKNTPDHGKEVNLRHRQ